MAKPRQSWPPACKRSAVIFNQTIIFDIPSNYQATHHTPARGKGEAAGPHEPIPMPAAARRSRRQCWAPGCKRPAMIFDQTINFDIQSNYQITHHTPARGKGQAAGPHEPTAVLAAARRSRRQRWPPGCKPPEMTFNQTINFDIQSNY